MVINMMKTEKIGNITLDLTYYPGEDFYCDGAVEDELLEIVKKYKPAEFQYVIEQEANWPVLYHLSPLRANIMEWFPVKEGSKVLEIGSGCGAITGALSRKAGGLTCIDLSKKRSMINAYRNQDKENICIKVGNFQDIEPHLDTDYDLICLIGVFEYAKGYIGNESPYTEFLKTIMKHVKPNGQVVIAIENRLGLKYFAGCREDHLGDFCSGIEDYPEGGVVRTFSRPGLEQIFKACDVENYHFYYPYPDYKFANTIFSDKRLPMLGELTSNLRNFDRSRLLLFDEKNAFDSMIRDGEFPLFSNSYFVVIGPDVPVTYSKFSNDRAEEYIIRTDIVCNPDNDNLIAKKVPMSEQAKTHIQKIQKAYELLKSRYENSDLVICPCEIVDNIITFPYLEGITLEEKLDSCLDKNDMDTFKSLLRKYESYVKYQEEMEVVDYDLIFPNILIAEDGTWQVIDYEWTYEKRMSGSQIMKRALYCYRLGSDKRRSIDMKRLAEEFQLGEWKEEDLLAEEIKFQKSVTGNRYSLSEMRDLIHNEVLPITDAIAIFEQKKQKQNVQLYYDYGNGFSEADSEFKMPITETAFETSKNCNADDAKNNMGERAFTVGQEDTDYVVKVSVKDGLKALRIDPAMESCGITIESVWTENAQGERKPYPVKNITSSGNSIGKDSYVFAHNDPNFTLPLEKNSEIKMVEFHYSIVRMPQNMAEKFGVSTKKKWFG